jgi:predicted AlkP superfamily phosphohydrolase/phosphomutase
MMISSKSRVFLVAVDGLSWNLLLSLVDQGLLPTFERFLEQGISGDLDVIAAVPGLDRVEKGLISPVLWTTAATGQYYFRHGIYDFCDFIANMRQPPLFGSQDVKVPRIWDILSAYQIDSLVVGYYLTYPATPVRGCMVSDLFGEVDSSQVVFPQTMADRLAQVLGASDYASYARQNRLSEAWVGKTFSSLGWSKQTRPLDPQQQSEIAAILHQFTDMPQVDIDDFCTPAASNEEEGTKSLLWYRLIYPFYRDQRFHRLFMALLDEYPDIQFATIYYRMIDFVSHGFWIKEAPVSEDFREAYQRTLPQAYCLIDQYLAEVTSKVRADDLLLILSDHGFIGMDSPGGGNHLKIGFETKLGIHEAPGVFIAVGETVAAEMRDSVSILDIAPSIMDSFGIPQSKEFDGGPVPGLLHPSASRKIEVVDRYLTAPFSSEPDHLSREEEEQIMRRLAALGYIDG